MLTIFLICLIINISLSYRRPSVSRETFPTEGLNLHYNNNLLYLPHTNKNNIRLNIN